MRNNSTSKYVIVFALLVSVAAISIGFAAFTSTLTIKAGATVQGPSTNFNVSLSKSSTAVSTGAVTPTVSGATGGNATLSATTISNLQATFTNVNQSVTYKFYAYNAGQFLAYLNSVSIGTKTCTAGSGTNQTYVDSACNGIELSVKVGANTYTSSNMNIASHTLAVGNAEEVEVKIEYKAGSATADGDFTVAFGDTVLTYGSAD